MKNTFFECAVGEPKLLIMCGLGRFASDGINYGHGQPLLRTWSAIALIRWNKHQNNPRTPVHITIV